MIFRKNKFRRSKEFEYKTAINSEYGFVYTDPVTVIDTDWVTSSFLTESDLLLPELAVFRFNAYGDLIYGNTRLGKSRSINPMPQYGPYIDEPTTGRMNATLSSDGTFTLDKDEVTLEDEHINDRGMGVFYSEHIAKYEQILYIEAGVPKFTSMFEVLSGLVDREVLIAATRGGSLTMYKYGNNIGNALAILYFPLVYAVVYAGKVLAKTYFPPKGRDYYVLKPTMHNYYKTVSSIMTDIAVELGVLAYSSVGEPTADKPGIPMEITNESFIAFEEYYPDFVSKVDINGHKVGYLDVYKLSLGSHKDIQDRKRLIGALHELAKKEYGDDEEGAKARYEDLRNAYLAKNDFRNYDKDGNLFSLHEKMLGLDSYKYKKNDDGSISNMNEAEIKAGKVPPVAATTDEPLESERNKEREEESWWNWLSDLGQYASMTHASFARFLPITVDYQGPTSYTFTNSVGEIGIERKFNDGSRMIDDFRYSAFGGNVMGDFITDLLGGFKSGLLGVMDGATMGLSNIVAGMASGGFITLPKKYQDSSMTLPRHNFKCHMASVSGHPMAQLTSNYLVIASLLGLTLPKTVGKGMYISPYILSAHLRGVCNIKLGMIDSLRITYGTGNSGRDTNNRPIAFEVEFSIVDMSELYTAPVSNPKDGVLANIKADNEPLSAFIRNMTGASLYRETDTTIFGSAASRVRISKLLMSGASYTSSARFGHFIGDNIPFIASPLSQRNIEGMISGITN